ncbi:hypothetical protein [Kitasatospora sp. RG8]|uniref:hypothetical protein n=1 Tax=Kitasatospora sp. RG8 TaxID=2820815 RepID=UPI001FD82264|nr:hypothetical protein [Kitasatospora sp. RG8]
MATTKKYTVTLPEKLAEQIRAQVGPGAFSRYVTEAIQRKHEQEQLTEFVDRWESEYGPVPDDAMAHAEQELRELHRRHAERQNPPAPTAQAS